MLKIGSVMTRGSFLGAGIRDVSNWIEACMAGKGVKPIVQHVIRQLNTT